MYDISPLLYCTVIYYLNYTMHTYIYIYIHIYMYRVDGRSVLRKVLSVVSICTTELLRSKSILPSIQVTAAVQLLIPKDKLPGTLHAMFGETAIDNKEFD